MQYRTLGNTDIQVSVIAMGCWAFAGGELWGEQDDRDSLEAVSAALDAGINFFDTAEGYGKGYSEEILGKALKGIRDKAVIATKVSPSNLTKEGIIEACERSLLRLQTDYIDLYQIHWPNRNIPISESMEALLKLQQDGKIRAIGVSNFGPQDLAEALSVGPIASNQLSYNLLWRAVEFEVQPQCVDHQVGILCYSPLMQGLLSGKYSTIDKVPPQRMRTKHFSKERPAARHREPGFEQETFQAIREIEQIAEEINEPMSKVALAWLIQRQGVASVIAGIRNEEHAKMNAEASELQLSDEIMQKLDQATSELKHKLGPDLDFLDYRIR